MDVTLLPAWTSAIAAIVALGISCWQIMASNRQALFERRLRLWTEVLQLVQMQDSAQGALKDDGEPIFAVDLIFGLYTNSVSMYKFPDALSSDNSKARIEFLSALEDLRVDSQQALFVFKGDSAEVISKYIYSYQTLLSELYRYGILVEKMKECQDRLHYEDVATASKAVGEEKYRRALLDADAKLNKARVSLEKLTASKTIQKQIKLC